jgi:hypothetical protein
MAKNKRYVKTPPPRFKKGDTVSFLFGSGTATGRIVEDRGRLGIGGAQVYGIRFEINLGDERYVEMPEDELTAGPADRISSKTGR